MFRYFQVVTTRRRKWPTERCLKLPIDGGRMQLLEKKYVHSNRCRGSNGRPRVGARSLSVVNNGHWQYPGTKSRKHLVREIQRIFECNFESLRFRFGVVKNSWKKSVLSRGLHELPFKREFAKRACLGHNRRRP